MSEPAKKTWSFETFLQDPIGDFLRDHAKPPSHETSVALSGLSVPERTEILGELYKEARKHDRASVAGPEAQNRLTLISALYNDPEIKSSYLDYWKRFKAERLELNGKYQQYLVLKNAVTDNKKKLHRINRSLFGHRSGRTNALDKMTYRSVERTLTQDREALETKIEESPKLEARASFERIQEYNKQLSDEKYIWWPSREGLLEKIEEATLIGRPVFLLGESGTGKTQLAEATARNLTGRLVFKAQGGANAARVEQLLGRTKMKGDQSYIEYGPLGQAITGKKTSLDTEASEGGVFFDDEFNNRSPEDQLELVKLISGMSAGKRVNMDLLGEFTVAPKFVMIVAGNPASKKYHRESTDIAVYREFGHVIDVPYPGNSTENPELYEGMLAALMDVNDRIRFSKNELSPQYKEGAQKTETKKERLLIEDAKSGGFLWRFSKAMDQMYKSFSRQETVLKDKGEGQFLSKLIIDPGIVLGWLRLAVETGYSGSLEGYVQKLMMEKLAEATVTEVDRTLAKDFFKHFGIFQSAKPPKEGPKVELLTPEEIGLLSPRVKYLEIKERKEAPPKEAVATIDGRHVKYLERGTKDIPLKTTRRTGRSGYPFFMFLGIVSEDIEKPDAEKRLVIEETKSLSSKKQILMTESEFLAIRDVAADFQETSPVSGGVKAPEKIETDEEKLRVALEVLGSDRVFGVKELENLLSMSIGEVPPIPYSIEEIRRSKEVSQLLGVEEALVLCPKTEVGNEFTGHLLTRSLEAKYRQLSLGKLWDATGTGDTNRLRPVVMEEKLGFEWRLVTMGCVPNTLGKRRRDPPGVITPRAGGVTQEKVLQLRSIEIPGNPRLIPVKPTMVLLLEALEAMRTKNKDGKIVRLFAGTSHVSDVLVEVGAARIAIGKSGRDGLGMQLEAIGNDAHSSTIGVCVTREPASSIVTAELVDPTAPPSPPPLPPSRPPVVPAVVEAMRQNFPPAVRRTGESKEFYDIRVAEKRRLGDFFNENIEPPLLPTEVTPTLLAHWTKNEFKLQFWPKKEILKGARFPGWKRKPGLGVSSATSGAFDFYGSFQKISALHENKKNPHLQGLGLSDLPGAWMLVDRRPSPELITTTARGLRYENDDLIQQALGDLSQQGIITGYKPGKRSGLDRSLFETSEFQRALRTGLGLEDTDTIIRLPRVIEASLMGQDLWHDDTVWYEWCEEYLVESQRAIIGGPISKGGVAYVHAEDGAMDSIGFRPVVVFPPRKP